MNFHDIGANHFTVSGAYIGDTTAGVLDSDAFTIGDVVSLVTGSPDFVVVDVCECGSIEVVWYDDNGFNGAKLPEEALTHA